MKNILHIEDNEQNRYLVTFLLERHGYRVTAAINGKEGLAIAPTLKPDLILLDIQLPEMDGYAVARALRSDPRCKHIPIVAVTSYAMAGDRTQALASGCDGYVEKPINPDTFIAELHAQLMNRRETSP